MRHGNYAFIYDDFLSDRKFEHVLSEVDARLASLDLTGRVGRLTLFRNARDIVQSLVQDSDTTVVVVGNDRTLDKVLWFLPDMQVTLAYIPVGPPTNVASLLGIPIGAGACDVLSARLIEWLDVGRLDDRYFLSEISLSNTNAAIEVEGKYRISPYKGGSIFIRNLGSLTEAKPEWADAKDGLLEVIVKPVEEKAGSGFFRKAEAPVTRLFLSSGNIVSDQPVEVKADYYAANGMRFEIGVEPKKLRFVTGRNRRISPEGEGLQKARHNANLTGI